MMRPSVEVAVVITLIHIKCLYVCTYCISSHNMCMATSVTSEAVKNVICFMFVLIISMRCSIENGFLPPVKDGVNSVS